MNEIPEKLDEFLKSIDNDEIKDDDKKSNNNKTVLTIENIAERRLNWGYDLVSEIIKRQKRFMIAFSIIFIALVFLQYTYLIYKIETVNSIGDHVAIIIAELITLSIETIGILGIITKYIFSNQISEIINGIYKHSHYKENINNDED